MNLHKVICILTCHRQLQIFITYDVRDLQAGCSKHHEANYGLVHIYIRCSVAFIFRVSSITNLGQGVGLRNHLKGMCN